MKFAYNFIENSNNIENRRAKGKCDRLSIERICAGPAVPLLYEFMKSRNPDMKRVFEEEGMKLDDIESKNIIDCGMKTKDPLCMKVVDKFTEMYGYEAGELAVKTLPTGGMYIVGGVTTGIQGNITGTKIFMDNFMSKGRISHKLNSVPVFVVKNEGSVGLKGCEECSLRMMRGEL